MSAGLHHASRLVLSARIELATTRLSTVRVCQLRHDSSELNWYRRRDSNPHCLVPKTSASSRLGYAGKTFPIANCRFPICGIRASGAEDQSEIGNELVDLARFERATSTFARSRSHSAELQVRIGMGI